MKHWTKKALSLVLVVVMIAAMLPFGMFSTGALNYSKTEFSIASANDWNDVASYAAANPSARFTGKTIKLTQNIDFGGATIPTLFSNNFEGTFDGQGYTISNFKTTTGAVIANVTNAGSLIKNVKIDGEVVYHVTASETDLSDGWQVFAGMLINRMDEGSVADVTIAGSITSNAYHVGTVAGVVLLANGKTASIQNVNASATVLNTRTRTSVGWHCAGGIIGNADLLGKASALLIKGVNMSGTVTKTDGPAGGVIGSVYDRNGDAPLYTGGTITIEDCNVSGTVQSGVGRAGNGVGGIVGVFGAFKRESNDYTAFEGDLNINNCVISGTLKNTNTTSTDPLAVGGVIGSMAYSHATVNVEHCLISASFPTQSLTATNGKGSGLIVGTVACQTMSSINVNNCVTTTVGANLVGCSVAKEESYSHYAWFSLNGKSQTSVEATNQFAAWFYTNGITDNSVLTVGADFADSMVQLNEKGFIQRVGGQITALAVQDTVADNATLTEKDTYAIRFIGASQVSDIASASMLVIVRDATTGTALKKYEKECELYDALNAYNLGGEKMAYYKASDYGAKKFLALTIGDIPGGTAYTFDFTPSYITTSGMTVTAEGVSITYDANGQYLKEREVFDVEELVLSPTVRVMSSNILVVDNEQTDYTGYLEDHEQRLKNMATIYNFYQPDFIGFQEVADSTQVNDVDCFDGVKTMQSVLKTYIDPKYEYVDFSAQLKGTSHFTPIMYDSTKWTPMEVNYDTTKECLIVNCTMHRWQWARFQSIDNPAYEVIIFNIHGPHNGTYHGATVKKNFFTEANAQIKNLEAKYPTVPIFVTGDYNINLNDAEQIQHINTFVSGTTLQSEVALTTNCEPSRQGIDHIFMTAGDATIKQFRMIDNCTSLRVSSDHAPVYVDALLNRKVLEIPGTSMGWGEGEILP